MKHKLLLLTLVASACGLGACDSTSPDLSAPKYAQSAPETGSNLRRVYTADAPPAPGMARQGNLDNMRTGGSMTTGTGAGLQGN